MTSPAPDTPRATFRQAQRLGHNREYQAAYKLGARKIRGPLAVFGRPNGLRTSRLGLSVGRRVGPAVVRVRLKRMLREAFRLQRGSLPPGYDLVVTVRPHRPLPLAEYRRLLASAWESLDREWKRRAEPKP